MNPRRPLPAALPLFAPQQAHGEAKAHATDVEALKVRIRAAIGDFYRSQRLKRGAR
jgi:hypothetical protein